ncbi:MAG: hypothetical protein C0622_00950 [Desulfuromonas sp.]|nr:MAG: hypothetical protein C0622_00950 [Desulfuromonas sp.]
MESESNFIFEMIISWGPIILLIVIWAAFVKKSGIGSSKKYMIETTQRLNEQLDEMKKMNENLNRICKLLSEKNNLKQ